LFDAPKLPEIQTKMPPIDNQRKILNQLMTPQIGKMPFDDFTTEDKTIKRQKRD